MTPPDDSMPPFPADAPRPAPERSVPRFEIEGFEEATQREAGRLFAPPAPEPPLQPFERLARPRPSQHRGESLEGAEPDREGAAAGEPVPWVQRLFWGALPLMLIVLGYAAVVLTQRGIGLAWDEAYYYEPSLRAGEWLTAVLRGDRPFDAAAIERYWGPQTHNEHPSMQKLLSGVAVRFFPEPATHYWAMRLPMAVLFGLTLVLVYWIGRRAWGPAPGLAAALMLATMPHVFGYAHFAAMEMPLLFFTMALVFCFLRGLDSPWWATLTGVVCGLLAATKINGLFMPIPLVLWGHLYARQRYVNNLFAMLVLGPVVFVAAWPWLWHDTLARILEYLEFHARHQQTALYFQHRIWGRGGVNAPWYYPLVMTAVTLPLSSLALIGYGVARTVVKAPVRPLAALFLTCALVVWGVACLPQTPRYDGVRLFLPVFPFLALLGAAGVVGLAQRAAAWAARRRTLDPERERGLRRRIVAAAIVVILVDGAVAIGRYHPYLLSYFNPLVGGVAGAERRGFEVTFWGECVNESVIETLNRLPAGARIKPLALHERCLELLQQWGMLNPDLRIGGDPPYDYHLLQMRRGMFARPERALAARLHDGAGERFPLVQAWGLHGVSLLALFRTGPEFEAYWPTVAPPPEVVRPPQPTGGS